MAGRLLSGRTSKSLTLTLDRILHPYSSPLLDPLRLAVAAAAPNGLRILHSSANDLQPSDPRSVVPRFRSDISRSVSPMVDAARSISSSIGSGKAFLRWYCMKASDMSSQLDQLAEKKQVKSSNCSSGVVSFSPLESSISTKERPSGLRSESLKIKRIELSQQITYALIPALLLISKSKVTTSLIVLSVFWQIHGFFKEIFLDYIHQEVTRKWVLIYSKLLLLIVAKDLLLLFDMA